MNIAGKTLLITGASRGIGRALVEEALRRGVHREEIFPDPASQSVADGWRKGAAKALERQFAGFVPAANA